MTIAGLKYLGDLLISMGIPYQFMEWSSFPVPDPYWVGQYSETPTVDEGGEFQSDFMLIGTTKHKYIKLERVKEQIRKAFPETGYTDIMSNGWGIMIAYESSFPIPSIEEGVHRLQINLSVKEWKGE